MKAKTGAVAVDGAARRFTNTTSSSRPPDREAGVLSSRTSNANPNPSTDAAAPWPPGFASAANK